MTQKNNGLAGSVKNGLNSAIRGEDEITTAIQGTVEVGGDFGSAAKSAMIGVLRGRKVVDGEALDLISMTAGRVLKSTVEGGGELRAAAKGSIEGAIEGAKDIGVGADDAVAAAASGLLKAAVEVGSDQAWV